MSRWLPDCLLGRRGHDGPNGVVDPSLYPAWRRLVLLDFAAQPALTITGDGPIAIGSSSVLVRNTAAKQAGAVFSLVPGEGLRLPCPATAGYTSCITHANPGIDWLFASHPDLPYLSARTPVRVLAELDLVHSNNSGYGVGFGVGFGDCSAPLETETGYTITGQAATTTVNPSFSKIYHNGYYCGSSVTGVSNLTGLYGRQKTIGIETPYGCVGALVSRGLLQAEGVDAIADPDGAASYSREGQSIACTGANCTPARFLMSSWGARLSSLIDSGASTARYAVVRRMAVDAYFGKV